LASRSFRRPTSCPTAEPEPQPQAAAAAAETDAEPAAEAEVETEPAAAETEASSTFVASDEQVEKDVGFLTTEMGHCRPDWCTLDRVGKGFARYPIKGDCHTFAAVAEQPAGPNGEWETALQEFSLVYSYKFTRGKDISKEKLAFLGGGCAPGDTAIYVDPSGVTRVAKVVRDASGEYDKAEGTGDGPFDIRWKVSIYELQEGEKVVLAAGTGERPHTLSPIVKFAHGGLGADTRQAAGTAAVTGLVAGCAVSGKMFAVDTGADEGARVTPLAELGSDGDELQPEFACQWMDTRDGKLVVGSNGLQKPVSWVKTVDPDLKVKQENWADGYDSIHHRMGMTNGANAFGEPYGYVQHAGVTWSPIHQKWFCFPRAISYKPYSADTVDDQGCSVLLCSDDNGFSNEHGEVENPQTHKMEHKMGVCVQGLLDKAPTKFSRRLTLKGGTPAAGRGCTGMTFIPGSGDTELVVCRTEKIDGAVWSFVSVVDVTSKVLMAETKVGGGAELKGVTLTRHALVELLIAALFSTLTPAMATVWTVPPAPSSTGASRRPTCGSGSPRTTRSSG
jgi:hypothetical protein